MRTNWELYTKSKHPAPRVSEAELRKLYYKDGMSMTAIGAKFGVTRERVRQWMERAGLARRHVGNLQKIPREKWPELCKDYVQRPRWGALIGTAREWGVNDSTIQRILIKSGVWAPGQARKIPIESWSRVCKDYLQLGSMAKVARIWHVSNSTIGNILTDMDMPRNPKGWPRKRSRCQRSMGRGTAVKLD